MSVQNVDSNFGNSPFPARSKQRAKDALLKECSATYCDVKYVGVYKKQKVYRGVVRDGIISDGLNLVFVNQNGGIKQMQGIDILRVLEIIPT